MRAGALAVGLFTAACAHARPSPSAAAARYPSDRCSIDAPANLTNEATAACAWAFVTPDFELSVEATAPPDGDLRAWLGARLDPSAEVVDGVLATSGSVTCLSAGDRSECIDASAGMRAAARGKQALVLARDALASFRRRSRRTTSS